MVELGKVCDVRDGTHDSPKFIQDGYPLITSKNIKNGEIDFEDVNYVSKKDFDKINHRSRVDDGDIIMPMIGTIGGPIVVKKDREFVIKNVALIKFQDNKEIINVYVKNILASEIFNNYIESMSRGGTQKFISLSNIRTYKISVPHLKIQKQIVAEAEKEEEIIVANKKLIEIMKRKIEKVIEKI